jgi:hypothetical protein
MAEVFKLPVKVINNGEESIIDMNFHCGTYATEKTFKSLGIGFNGFLVALDENFSEAIRTFVYFAAMDAQKLKTPKGEAIDFPYDLEDVYLWMDEWGGAISENTSIFLRKMFHSVYGKEAGEALAKVIVDGQSIEEVVEEKKNLINKAKKK